MGGIPLPSRGRVGKNWSTGSKTITMFKKPPAIAGKLISLIISTSVITLLSRKILCWVTLYLYWPHLVTI